MCHTYCHWECSCPYFRVAEAALFGWSRSRYFGPAPAPTPTPTPTPTLL